MTSAHSAQDVWAYGMVVWQLLAGHSLCQTNSEGELVHAEDWGLLSEWREETKAGRLAKISDPAARNLFEWLMSRDPDRRPTMANVLQHAFFATCDSFFSERAEMLSEFCTRVAEVAAPMRRHGFISYAWDAGALRARQQAKLKQLKKILEAAGMESVFLDINDIVGDLDKSMASNIVHSHCALSIGTPRLRQRGNETGPVRNNLQFEVDAILQRDKTEDGYLVPVLLEGDSESAAFPDTVLTHLAGRLSERVIDLRAEDDPAGGWTAGVVQLCKRLLAVDFNTPAGVNLATAELGTRYHNLLLRCGVQRALSAHVVAPLQLPALVGAEVSRIAENAQKPTVWFVDAALPVGKIAPTELHRALLRQSVETSGCDVVDHTQSPTWAVLWGAVESEEEMQEVGMSDEQLACVRDLASQNRVLPVLLAGPWAAAFPAAVREGFDIGKVLIHNLKPQSSAAEVLDEVHKLLKTMRGLADKSVQGAFRLSLEAAATAVAVLDGLATTQGSALSRAGADEAGALSLHRLQEKLVAEGFSLQSEYCTALGPIV